MSVITVNAVEAALRDIVDPYIKQDLFLLKGIKNVQLADGNVQLDIQLGYPCDGLRQTLTEKITSAVLAVPGANNVDLNLSWSVQANATANTDNLSGVKHIIPVASGKGGVGKSTVAVNLALALAREGAAVGMLDADIYGPSQHIMLGLGSAQPQVVEQKLFQPLQAHGIKAISMGSLVSANTPMVWRGPMASGALQQLTKQTLWGELDFLIIDMPPGTGDIQLTLSQSVPSTGAVIVTTPQDIALLDAKKGIEMFRKVGVPVLGVVENMAFHVCTACGHRDLVFGQGGGHRIAQEYQTTLLGSLPLDSTIREDVDGGNPTVVANPASTISDIYRDIARYLGAMIWKLQLANRKSGPEIVISND